MATDQPDASAPVTISLASSEAHFAQILALQRRYLVRSLPPDVQDREGFVFAEHNLPLLQRMASLLPQAIALAEGKVVAYCLSLHPSLQEEIPQLAPMFGQFGRCSFRGRPLQDLQFMVGGQVCVDRPYRGLGLLGRLYRQVRAALSPDYELCVTEISSRNQVSLRAHHKLGFETIGSYASDGENWEIVSWDLRI